MARYLILLATLIFSACASDPTDPGVDPFDDPDLDGDGWTRLEGDCNDSDPAINPEEIEACDQIDTDCDGELDNGFPALVWYAEADGDGWAPNGAKSTTSCDWPGDGWASAKGDCDDTNSEVNPGELDEICGNGLDDDCNANNTDTTFCVEPEK